MDINRRSLLFILVIPFLLLSCEGNVQQDPRTIADKKPVLDKVINEPLIVREVSSRVEPDFDTTLWTEVVLKKQQIDLDLRYATNNNFVKEQLYDCPRCFLRPEAANALYEVQSHLQKQGYSLKLFDCYRPKSIQEKLWEIMPNATYVTPPHKGSMHNRGLAIDATLVYSSGKEVDMGTEFDFFGRRAHHDHRDLDEEILKHRKLLKESMALFGFKHIRTEWWHYSYKGPYKSPFVLADFQWPCE